MTDLRLTSSIVRRVSRSHKRGAGAQMISLDDVPVIGAEPNLDILALDAALMRWESKIPARARWSRCGTSAGSPSKKSQQHSTFRWIR